MASALGEPKRLHALGLLVHGELCLCDLTVELELSASTVSNHMAILKRAGLVEARKEGRWMYFRLPETGPASMSSQALTWALSNLSESINPNPSRSKEECCP